VVEAAAAEGSVDQLVWYQPEKLVEAAAKVMG
jgi:hypothetical protein